MVEEVDPQTLAFMNSNTTCLAIEVCKRVIILLSKSMTKILWTSVRKDQLCTYKLRFIIYLTSF